MFTIPTTLLTPFRIGEYTPRHVRSVNNRVWLDPSNQSTITYKSGSSGKITAIDDLSGNGFNISQSTDSDRMNSGTLFINGLDTVSEIAGTNCRMFFDSGNLPTNCRYCMAVVLVRNSSDTQAVMVLGSNEALGGNNREFWVRRRNGSEVSFDGDGSGGGKGKFAKNLGSFSGSFAALQTITIPGVPILAEGYFEDAGGVTLDTIYGAQDRTKVNNVGMMGDIAWFDGVPTEAERQSLGNAWIDKWNI